LYQFLFNEPLADADNSLVDAKAQSSLVLHPLFVPFINRTQNVHLVATKIFTTTQQNDWRKKMDPTGPVHPPWINLNESNNHIKWKPKAGPTS
jgi:hypothetical protein